MYVPQLLYPFICRWTSRLLLYPSYCKQCYHEHGGAYVFFSYGFLRVYAQQWDCWVMWWFYSWCFKESPYCFPQWLYQFTFPPTVQEGSLYPFQNLLFVHFLTISFNWKIFSYTFNSFSWLFRNFNVYLPNIVRMNTLPFYF